MEFLVDFVESALQLVLEFLLGLSQVLRRYNDGQLLLLDQGFVQEVLAFVTIGCRLFFGLFSEGFFY